MVWTCVLPINNTDVNVSCDYHYYVFELKMGSQNDAGASVASCALG